MSSSEGSAPEQQDGRVRRGARNRALIVDALLALVREGNLRPTADEVADRAGVGVRTVFRHFDDMEELRAAIYEQVRDEVRPLMEGPPIEGELEERIGELVRRRSVLYDRVANYERSAVLVRRRSKFLQNSMAERNRDLKEEVMRVLAPDLVDLPNWILEGLDQVLSFEAWERLRVHQGLEQLRALHVVERSVLMFVRAAVEKASS